MQQRQDDAEADALLNRQHEQREHGGDDEREFGAAAPPDVDHRPDPEDALSDEQQHAGKRRVRHMGEQPAAERRQRQREAGADKRAELRSAAGLGDDRRARRAGVERKGAEKAGEQVGGAEADEVAADVGADRRIGNETARRRRGLHHDDERDDDGERRDLRQVGERHLRPTEPQRRPLDGSERRDAAPVEPKDGDCRGGERQPDQRARKARAQALAHKHQRRHEQAKAERRQAGLAERSGERDDLDDKRARRRRDAEEGRRLADDNVSGNAGEETGGDRN